MAKTQELRTVGPRGQFLLAQLPTSDARTRLPESIVAPSLCASDLRSAKRLSVGGTHE